MDETAHMHRTRPTHRETCFASRWERSPQQVSPIPAAVNDRAAAGAAHVCLSVFDAGARIAFEKAGVDTADPEAVRRFVRDNPAAANAVSANAVTAAVTGTVSDKLGGWLAQKIANKVGGNWMVENSIGGIAERGISNLFKPTPSED